ncbi:Bromodomain containing protein [Parasponia andersonii]|uniref:Bromodomain containing protein n=1 Tax=Parasponia andersonii TaxID=3476 RepID=A0A2P5BJ10_PARAD|nr:Bromodomain containing protein [Parasponia andersonii]
MKRKRGHKKGKSKGASASASAVSAKEAVSSVAVVVNVENDSGLVELDNDNNSNNNKDDSGMEIDTPSSTGTDQPQNIANVNPDGSIGKGIGKPLGRVKVKLRTPKLMEAQLTSSDAPTQSDTDKSSQQMGLEKQGVVTDKMEDSANSLPEAQLSAPGNLSKKAGSIKIKSSKALGSSISHTKNDSVPPTRDVSPHRKEQKTRAQDPRFKKQELDTCLMVIKKVMKMDAAEPFNVPVNPIALGIPVRPDGIQEKVALSGQGNLPAKGGQSKKAKKGHGRRHKADCLCAICVLKRRRREREENDRIAKAQIGDADNNPPQELKREESSPAESVSGDNTSSDMDESSVDPNAITQVEERKEAKMEESKQHSQPFTEKEEEEENDEEEVEGNDEDGENEDNILTPEQFDKSNGDANNQSGQAIAEESDDRIQFDTQKEDTTMQHKEGTESVEKEKHKGTEETHPKVKAKPIKLFENPMLLDLCGILFPNDANSIWSGPHSLVHRQSTSRARAIHSAIGTLMK